MCAHKVYANSLEIAGAATDHKCVAAMPDVCLSPPSPPAGPLAIPYPNTSMSKDLKNGSKDVSLGGSPITLEDQSHYKSSPLGDEASTKLFGANVIDHTNAGETHVQAHSSDVVVEKKAVTRTGDLATSNHASDQPGGGAMTPQLAGAGGAGETEAKDECPCCHGPLHANQKDAGGNPLNRVKPSDYYAGKKATVDKKIAGFEGWAAKNKDRLAEIWPLKFGSAVFGTFSGTPAQIAQEEARRAKQMLDEVQQLMAANGNCPNVHKSDDGCGTHFADVPPGAAAKARDAEFTNAVRTEANRRAAAKLGKAVPKNTKVNHITPLDAGGCPKAPGNTVSDAELSDPACARIESLQTALQGR